MFQVLNCDHPRPLRPVVRPVRPVVRSFYDLPTNATFLRSQVGRNLIVSPVGLGLEHDHDFAAVAEFHYCSYDRSSGAKIDLRTVTEFHD